MNITINPMSSYANKPKALLNSQTPPQFPPVTSQPQKMTKFVSFGDADLPSSYDFGDAMYKLRQNKTKITGDTPEAAFTTFFRAVKSQLSTVNQEEAQKEAAAKGNFLGGSGRQYKVNIEMPVSESRYVSVMSSFIKAHGVSKVLQSPEIAIENHLVNNLGIYKPKFWDAFKASAPKTDYHDLRDIIEKTYRFVKEGLVTIKSVK